MKVLNRDLGKKENLASKVPSVSSSTGKQQQQEGQQVTGAQPPKTDESSDCYLKDLYTQVTSVVLSKPDERENINEGELIKFKQTLYS